jgi:RNA polymerase sigma-70 factor (ECF subfamily)
MGAPGDLQRLVERARAGDSDAWERLERDFSGALERCIHEKLGAKLRRRVSTEDLRQLTLLQAFKALPRFEWKGEDSFLAWLRTIAENAVREAGRHEGAGKRSPDREVAFVESPGSLRKRAVSRERLLGSLGGSPSKGAQRQERMDRLVEALERLRPEHREVILRISVDREPVKQVAAAMGRTPAATSMLLLRALRKLREAYGEIDSTDSLRLPRDGELGRDARLSP